MTEIFFRSHYTGEYFTTNGLGPIQNAVPFKMVRHDDGSVSFQYGDRYICRDYETGEVGLREEKPMMFDYVESGVEGEIGRYECGSSFLSFGVRDSSPDHPLCPLEFGPTNYRGPRVPGNLEVYVPTVSDWIYIRFMRDGVAVFPGTTSMESVDKARSKLLESEHSRLSGLLQLDPVFAEFLKDERLLQLLQSIYPQDFHLTTYSSNTLRKPTGTVLENYQKMHWHVDYPYHDLPMPYPDIFLGVQVIYALDDFTEANGATLYMPGSFQSHIYPSPQHVEERNNLIRRMIMPKGSVVVYRGDLWHSQGINTTDNPRAGLLANFSPLYVPAKGIFADEIPLNKSIHGIKNVDGKKC